MLLDKQLLMSDAQVVNANGNSTDYIDFGSARNLGAGQELQPVFHIGAKSGTTPTLRALVVGADDSTFSTNKVTLMDTGTLTDPPIGFVRLAIPSHPPKRYMRIEYTVGGGTPSFSVTAGLAYGSEQTAGLPY